eukprot:1329313-Pyramimonas_sp.AAC.1
MPVSPGADVDTASPRLVFASPPHSPAVWSAAPERSTERAAWDPSGTRAPRGRSRRRTRRRRNPRRTRSEETALTLVHQGVRGGPRHQRGSRLHPLRAF